MEETLMEQPLLLVSGIWICLGVIANAERGSHEAEGTEAGDG